MNPGTEEPLTAYDVRHRADLVRQRAKEFGAAVAEAQASRAVLVAVLLVAVAAGLGYMAGSMRRGGPDGRR